jgi:hypothetical protein
MDHLLFVLLTSQRDHIIEHDKVDTAGQLFVLQRSHYGACLALTGHLLLVLLHLVEVVDGRPPVLLHVVSVSVFEMRKLWSLLERQVVRRDEVKTPTGQLSRIV